MNKSVIPMGGEPEDEFSQLLRGALHHEASQVNPPDRFEGLLQAIDEADFAQTHPKRGRFLWLVAASIAMLALGVAVPLMLPHRPTAPAQSPASTQPAPTSASAEPSLATLQKDVPVYFVGRSDGLLYREFWDLNTQTDRVTTAVIATINRQPHDPTYTSAWAQGQVNSVTVKGNRIVIDLSRSVFATWQSRDQATKAVNQVVYTAIANVGDRYGQKTVQILVDGSPNLPIIGVPPTDFTLNGLTPCAQLWVKYPEYAASMPAGTVTFVGYLQSASTVKALNWTVLSSGDQQRVVAKGTTTAVAPSGEAWSEWRIVTDLPRGSYQLVIKGDGVSQTKAFTLT